MIAHITKYEIKNGQRLEWSKVTKSYDDVMELCYELANLGFELDLKDAYTDILKEEVYYNIPVEGSYAQ